MYWFDSAVLKIVKCIYHVLYFICDIYHICKNVDCGLVWVTTPYNLQPAKNFTGELSTSLHSIAVSIW
jgi:hypothetical protein